MMQTAIATSTLSVLEARLFWETTIPKRGRPSLTASIQPAICPDCIMSMSICWHKRLRNFSIGREVSNGGFRNRKVVRKLCDKYSVVLIYDEVDTGFRLALGGTQEFLTRRRTSLCLRNSSAAVLPLGVAFGGRDDVMSVLTPGVPLWQGIKLW